MIGLMKVSQALSCMRDFKMFSLIVLTSHRIVNGKFDLPRKDAMMESIQGFYKETVQISSRKHMNSFGSGVYGFCSFKMLNSGFKPDSTRIISNLTPSKLNELILKIMSLEKVSPASSMASFWVSMFNFVGASTIKQTQGVIW